MPKISTDLPQSCSEAQQKAWLSFLDPKTLYLLNEDYWKSVFEFQINQTEGGLPALLRSISSREKRKQILKIIFGNLYDHISDFESFSCFIGELDISKEGVQSFLTMLKDKNSYKLPNQDMSDVNKKNPDDYFLNLPIDISFKWLNFIVASDLGDYFPMSHALAFYLDRLTTDQQCWLLQSLPSEFFKDEFLEFSDITLICEALRCNKRSDPSANPYEILFDKIVDFLPDMSEASKDYVDEVNEVCGEDSAPTLLDLMQFLRCTEPHITHVLKIMKSELSRWIDSTEELCRWLNYFTNEDHLNSVLDLQRGKRVQEIDIYRVLRALWNNGNIKKFSSNFLNPVFEGENGSSLIQSTISYCFRQSRTPEIDAMIAFMVVTLLRNYPRDDSAFFFPTLFTPHTKKQKNIPVFEQMVQHITDQIENHSKLVFFLSHVTEKIQMRMLNHLIRTKRLSKLVFTACDFYDVLRFLHADNFQLIIEALPDSLIHASRLYILRRMRRELFSRTTLEEFKKLTAPESDENEAKARLFQSGPRHRAAQEELPYAPKRFSQR
jgi:hypothetical protein